MKKIIAGLLTIMLIISSAVVFADGWEQEITVSYNGDKIDFETQPQIINDRTMVPFRAIFETLGGTVEFDGATRTVSSLLGGKKLSFVIGEYEAVLETSGGKEIIPIDSAPVIVNDYTLVPVRFVAESSGLKVIWDDFYREVVIIDTDAWKREIEQKSPFINMLLDMPLSAMVYEKPMQATENVDIEVSLGIENANELLDEGEKAPQNIDANITFKISSEEKFDGENAISKSAVAIDLSSLYNFIKEMDSSLSDVDLLVMSDILKLHNFNIEIITDKDKNVYIKNKEIKDMIKELGGEETAEMIGDNYIKIPYPVEINEPLESATLWSYLETMALNNETLTTEDAVMIGYIIDVLGDLYSEESVRVEQKANGGYKITFDVTKDDYMKAMENLTDAIWEYEGLHETEIQFVEEQKKQMLESFGKVDLAIKGYVDAKDAVNQSQDINAFIKINDLFIPDTENVRLSASININAKSVSKETVNYGKINVPDQVIDITQNK